MKTTHIAVIKKSFPQAVFLIRIDAHSDNMEDIREAVSKACAEYASTPEGQEKIEKEGQLTWIEVIFCLPEELLEKHGIRVHIDRMVPSSEIVDAHESLFGEKEVFELWKNHIKSLLKG